LPACFPVFAQYPDKSPDGNEVNRIQNAATTEAEEPGRKPDPELFHLDSDESRCQKVAGFMSEDENRENGNDV
jgi:hypothetical protein